MAASISDCPHVQVKFFTKQPQHSVPDSPFSVPSTVTIDELSTLINGILRSDDADEPSQIVFDFLIDGEFLRSSLEKYIELHDKSFEDVLEIEYLERQAAPTPEDSLQHDDWVSCLHGNESLVLSGCYDNTVKIWNTDGTNLTTIPGHSGPIKCVSWIKRDENKMSFVSGSHDQSLMLWEWDSNTNSVECRNVCKGHGGSVDCVAVDSSASRFVSGSWDKMLKIWSTTPDDAGEESNRQKKRKRSEMKIPTKVPVATLSGHKEAISSVVWTDVNEVCTGSWDHTLKIWDLREAVEKHTLNCSKVFLCVSHHPKTNLLVTGSADRHVRLWDARVRDGPIVQSTFTSHTGWITGVSWSPKEEHLFISGSYDCCMKLWDTRSPKAPLYDMTGHEERILAVDWSIPQLMMSAGADNHIKIYQHKSEIP